MKMIRCALILAIAVAIVGPHLAEAANDEIICYFGSWAIYHAGTGQVAVEKEDISPELCPQLIYTFVGVDRSGSVRILEPWNEDDGRVQTNLVDLRAANPSLKAMLAIGSDILSDVASSPPSLRRTFVKSVISFLDQHHFDGLALHFPGASGGPPSFNVASIQLLKVLKQKFDKMVLILAAPAITSRSFTCTVPGYYADPADCHNFYFCDVNNNAIPYSCAPGLLFDKTLRICNLAANVIC